jgi:hypothetical protein
MCGVHSPLSFQSTLGASYFPAQNSFGSFEVGSTTKA